MTEASGNLFGMLLQEMAARRGVRGPYKVAAYVQKETGEGPGGSGWSQILSGDTYRPRREVVLAFAKAFRLSSEELQRLAHVFTYDEEPPEDMEIYPEYAELAVRLRGERPESTAAPMVEEKAGEEHPNAFSGWTGQRVHASLENNEEVRGVLQAVTEYGFVVDCEGRGGGPCFYSWKLVRWMQPIV